MILFPDPLQSRFYISSQISMKKYIKSLRLMKAIRPGPPAWRVIPGPAEASYRNRLTLSQVCSISQALIPSDTGARKKEDF